MDIILNLLYNYDRWSNLLQYWFEHEVNLECICSPHLVETNEWFCFIHAIRNVLRSFHSAYSSLKYAYYPEHGVDSQSNSARVFHPLLPPPSLHHYGMPPMMPHIPVHVPYPMPLIVMKQLSLQAQVQVQEQLHMQRRMVQMAVIAATPTITPRAPLTIDHHCLHRRGEISCVVCSMIPIGGRNNCRIRKTKYWKRCTMCPRRQQHQTQTIIVVVVIFTIVG